MVIFWRNPTSLKASRDKLPSSVMAARLPLEEKILVRPQARQPARVALETYQIMAELYTTTLKYFHLAISEFLPQIEILCSEVRDEKVKEKLEDLIEAYEDVDEKITSYNLNYDDPNRYYDGEPVDIEVNLSDKMVANLAQLTHRLLDSWKNRKQRLEQKEYLTASNNEELCKLKDLIWPLEALMKTDSYIVGKYANLGPLMFPGENEKVNKQNFSDAIQTIKNRFKTEGIFIESRSQGKDLHLLIGKRDGTSEKAHVVIDAKTGEIRVEDNQKEPIGLVEKIESILTLPDGKRIRITREAIEELRGDQNNVMIAEKLKQQFAKNEANFRSGKNSTK